MTPISPSFRAIAWRSNAATRIPKRLMCGFSPAAAFSNPSRVRAAVNRAAEFPRHDPEPDPSELYPDVLL